MSYTRRLAYRAVLAAGLLLLLGALVAAPVQAKPNPPAPEHNDFGALTAVWWKWVNSHEAVEVGGTNTFPILDTTGQFAAVGQRNGIGPANKFFFLAGTFGGKVTRAVTVPRGKALFFPIINVETDNAVPEPPPTPFTVPQLRQQAKAAIDTASGLAATFDGKPVRIFRTVSPVFAYTLPPQNTIYDFFELVGPQFEGTIKPAVGDGYWSYIPPPAPGRHVLKFQSKNGPDFNLDVTYNLTVA